MFILLQLREPDNIDSLLVGSQFTRYFIELTVKIIKYLNKSDKNILKKAKNILVTTDH